MDYDIQCEEFYNEMEYYEYQNDEEEMEQK